MHHVSFGGFEFEVGPEPQPEREVVAGVLFVASEQQKSGGAGRTEAVRPVRERPLDHGITESISLLRSAVASVRQMCAIHDEARAGAAAVEAQRGGAEGADRRDPSAGGGGGEPRHEHAAVSDLGGLDALILLQDGAWRGRGASCWWR